MIVLQCLFGLRESRDLFFQGGTAIRWFFGGYRFSEDLDLVSPWSSEKAETILEAAIEPIRRHLVANFGSGNFSLRAKKSRAGAYRTFIDFSPEGMRSKISVKVELEQLAEGMRPEANQVIMQSAPAVAYFLREAGFRSAGTPVIVNVEKPEEILTDKMRALMERPYTKGRDFFDVWFLTRTVGVRPDRENLRRKLALYAAPFKEKRPASFYAGLDGLKDRERKALAVEIQQDLTRFLDLKVLGVLARDDYEELLKAVQEVFKQMAAPEKGIVA